MGEEIYHLPCDVWKYYQDHIEELKVEVEVIASNTKTATYIDIAVGDDDVLAVEAWDSDDLIEFIQLEDEEQCEFIISELYKTYITGEDDTSLDEDDGRISTKELAIERDKEIDDAVEDLIRALCPDRVGDFINGNRKDDFVDIKEHICEYLFRKHHLDIFRPMLLNFGDGVPRYVEYPYDQMKFADETNPIYMD